MRKKVLFLCTHNSARSQIAEGLAKKYFGDKYLFFSAGTNPTRPHPLALKVLQEEGIDTSTLYSKSVNEFVDKEIDLVITVCDSAKENCPVFYHAKKMIHHDFEDPSLHEGTEEEKIKKFRETKEEIKAFLFTLFSD